MYHSRQLRLARPCMGMLAPARYQCKTAAPLRRAWRRVPPRKSIENLDLNAKWPTSLLGRRAAPIYQPRRHPCLLFAGQRCAAKTRGKLHRPPRISAVARVFRRTRPSGVAVALARLARCTSRSGPGRSFFQLRVVRLRVVQRRWRRAGVPVRVWQRQLSAPSSRAGVEVRWGPSPLPCASHLYLNNRERMTTAGQMFLDKRMRMRHAVSQSHNVPPNHEAEE